MRKGEVEGREYYFVSEEEFQRNIDNGNLLEWAQFVGHKYGTPLDKLNAMRENGKNVILEIDVQGTEQVLKKCEKENPVTFFIMPPSFNALEARIRGRCTEGEEAIEARLAKARSEMLLKDNYKYVIQNDDITRAAIEIQNIIRSELVKANRNR
jgi:guanylate kinase